MYIENKQNVVVQEYLENDKFKKCIWCDIISGKDKTVVGICNRAPNSSELEDEGLLEIISRLSYEWVMIMGTLTSQIQIG